MNGDGVLPRSDAPKRGRRVFLWTVVAFLALAAQATAHADGLIVVSNPPTAAPGHFGFAPLQVLYHRVNVSVNGLVAVTEVDQEFYNASTARLEGTYVFPIPAGRPHRPVLHGGGWKNGGG